MITNQWTKSSTCESNTCVEVMAHDHERCETGGCVEVMAADSRIYVSGQTFTIEEWREFVAGVKLGEFDV